jgi:hypothetical protein
MHKTRVRTVESNIIRRGFELELCLFLWKVDC